MGKAATLRNSEDQVSTIVFGDGRTKVTITNIDSDGKFVKVYAESPDTITFGVEPRRAKHVANIKTS